MLKSLDTSFSSLKCYFGWELFSSLYRGCLCMNRFVSLALAFILFASKIGITTCVHHVFHVLLCFCCVPTIQDTFLSTSKLFQWHGRAYGSVTWPKKMAASVWQVSCSVFLSSNQGWTWHTHGRYLVVTLMALPWLLWRWCLHDRFVWQNSGEVNFNGRMLVYNDYLGGGFKYFYVHPYLWKISNLTIFFRWVETTNQ